VVLFGTSKDGKKITSPLTFVLSRRGRGEKEKRVKGIPLNFLPIDGGG
jgi:hypothetical protein